MIYCSGLLPKRNIGKIKEAYALYRSRKIAPSDAKAQEFRQQNESPQIDITLMGCWDTVGALGLPQIIPWLPLDNLVNKKYRFHDTKLNRKIRFALHGIAIDERRKVFDVTHMGLSDNASTFIKAVWFPGEHGCVGGGTESTAGLSDAALQWMVEEIGAFGLGLEFDLSQVKGGVSLNHKAPFPQNLGIYKIAGVIDRRITGEVEGLHLSVKSRWKDLSNYRPINLAQRFDAYLSS